MENPTTPNEQKSEPIIERPGARQLDDQQPYTPTPQAMARIDEIRKSPEYYTSSTKQKALAAEMHRLMTGAPEVAREGETENQAAIRTLNQSGKLMSKDPTVRADAMRELRQRLAAESTEADTEALIHAPVTALRERFGIEHDAVLKPLQAQWDTQFESDALASFAYHGVGPEDVRAVVDFYVEKFNGALGNAANLNFDEAEAEFRALGKKRGLPAKLIDALVEGQKGRLQ
jgi:hypothetical protein